MNLVVILLVVEAVIALGVLAFHALDRSARAEAWQRIAAERRWNHEHRDRH